MLEEIKEKLKSTGKDDIDSKIFIKCGKTKFVELIDALTFGTISISDTIGMDLESDKVEEFQFNQVFLAGYGYISFEHDPSLKDNEYIIENI